MRQSEMFLKNTLITVWLNKQKGELRLEEKESNQRNHTDQNTVSHLHFLCTPTPCFDVSCLLFRVTLGEVPSRSSTHAKLSSSLSELYFIDTNDLFKALIEINILYSDG